MLLICYVLFRQVTARHERQHQVVADAQRQHLTLAQIVVVQTRG